MSDFQILSGNDIPAVQRTTKYPWASMEAGQNIFVPADKGALVGANARRWVATHRPDLAVVTRTMPDETVGIWFVDASDEYEDEGEGDEE